MDDATDQLLPAFLATSVSFLAVRLRNEFRARLIDRYQTEGLSPTQGAILLCLEEDPPLTQKGLCELMRMDPSDAVRLLDDLERLSLIQRVPDPADRRRNLLILTSAGQAQVGRCMAVIGAAEDDLLGPLSADERRLLRTLLIRVISAVDSRIPLERVPASLEPGGVR